MKMLKKHIRLLIPLLCGITLIISGMKLEAGEKETHADGLILHNAAFTALENNDPQLAYGLFIQSFFYSTDPEIRAYSLFDAATIGWVTELSGYEALVGLYKESLRNAPGFYEAAFNLEYLYMLKANTPQLLPLPGEEGGEGESDTHVHGPEI